MNTIDIITHIESAKESELEAKRKRLAAYRAFAVYIKGLMVRHKIDRGTLRRRLGWPDSKIGNFLHLDYRLDPHEMIALAESMTPLTQSEKKIARRQPKRTKALLS
jgi:hypothetical protein